MRFEKPKPFDPTKEYKIGERMVYDGKILVAKKYIEVDAKFIQKYSDLLFKAGIFPTQCGMCNIKYSDCKGMIESPCQKYNRKDKKNIHFLFKKHER